MLTAGIICEFDPFHNGHAFLFEKVRSQLGAQRIVCVMSGDLTQRGALSGWDKFDRAKAAVICGADLVLELPFAYAVSSADLFARGGIRILKSLGCVTHLAFGSESADIDMLSKCASVLSQTDSDAVKEALGKGVSYPKALSDVLGDDAPKGPNDILAACYIREISLQDAGFVPFAVKREGPGHGELSECGRYASASEIRSRCKKDGSLQSCKDLIPQSAYKILSESGFTGVLAENRLFAMIRHALLVQAPEETAKTPEVSEGLENRLKEAAANASDLDDLIKRAKSKRYTYARISRALLQLLCRETKSDIALFERSQTAYAKVLAFSGTGAQILKQAASNGAEIISNINKYIPKDGSVSRMLALDLAASDIFSIAAGRTISKFSDKTCVPIIIKQER